MSVTLLSELEAAPLIFKDLDGLTETAIIRKIRRLYREKGIEDGVYKDAGKWYIPEEIASNLGRRLCSNLYQGKIARTGGSEERSELVRPPLKSTKVQDYLKAVN